MGPDANWDLRNYHYYNGRSIATGSFLSDVSPAGIQTYLNPFLDVPTYLSVQIMGPRFGLVVWMAVVQWLCSIAVWRLAGEFDSLRRSLPLRITAAAFAFLGSGAVSLAFTTFGDWAIAALICEAMTRIMRWARGDDPNQRTIMWAGALLGLAMGIKLTSAPFLIGATIAIAITFSIPAALRLVSGGAIGLGVLGGPWMAVLAFRFGNPVFPFYNQLFRSESAPTANFDDGRYGTRSLKDLIDFPFDMYRGGVNFTEIAIRDWRFCGLLILGTSLALISPSTRLRSYIHNQMIGFWAIMLVVSYVLWATVFGIYRYLLFAEIAISIGIVVIAAEMISDRLKLTVVALAALLVGITFQAFPDWGRGDIFTNPELEMLVEQHDDQPMHVIFSGSPPLSYMTASFPTSTRFAALFPYVSNELLLAGTLDREFGELVGAGLASDSLYMIVDDGVQTPPDPLGTLHFDNCEPFKSLERAWLLCALRED